MSPSRLWDARHLVVDRIEELEMAAAKLEALLYEAARRREELQRRLEEGQSAWRRALRSPGRAHAAELNEAFAVLASARSELAAVEERQRALGLRMSDAMAEQEVLRTVFQTVEDLVVSNGSSGHDHSALRQASRNLFQGVERERRRIARDLRDGPAGALADVVGRIRGLEQVIGTPGVAAEQELAELGERVRRVLEEARARVVDVEPIALDELGLMPSLRRTVRDFRRRTGIPTELTLEGDPHDLDSVQELAVYWIIQEALDNVRRHSRARAAAVVLSFLAQGLRVTVRDDGVGFDVINMEAMVDANHGFGLSAMRERAAAADGTVQIQSYLGRGTEVLATFVA